MINEDDERIRRNLPSKRQDPDFDLMSFYVLNDADRRWKFEEAASAQIADVHSLSAFLGFPEAELIQWIWDTYDGRGKPTQSSMAEHTERVLTRFREKGKMLIAISQMRGIATNQNLAVFLGRQYLGQTDQGSDGMKPIRIANDVPKR